MHRTSTDKEYYESGKMVIDADGIPVDLGDIGGEKVQAAVERVERIAESTSWSGDRLTVNGKTSPSLTGPKGADGTVKFDSLTESQKEQLRGDVSKSQLDTAITAAIVALAPTGLKLVLAAPDDKTAEQADAAIRAKGYGAVVVVPNSGNWWE